MSPETFSLVVLVDPAPGSRRNVDIGSVDCERDHDNNSHERPDTAHEGDKDLVGHLASPDNEQEGMKSDGKHEETTARVTDLQPETLQEACSSAGLDLVLDDPFQTDNKREGLLEVCEDQVVDENDVLVVTDVSLVVGFPEHQSPGDETEERCRRKKGEKSHDRDGDKPSTLG